MTDQAQVCNNSPKPLVDAPGVSEPASEKAGVATRAARRAKNKKNVDEGFRKEEHIELKEPVKPKRGTALTNAVNKRAQIQIGKAYQAPLVAMQDPNQAMDDEDRDVQLWQNDPTVVDETRLDEFLDESVGVYRIQMDKALYILQLANYNMAIARKEIQSRKIVDEEWSDDDKILFRMAYQQYGKNFSKIKQVIPYRSISSVIQYYYHVKKRWKDKSQIQDLEAVEIINTASADDHPSDNRRSRRRNEFFPGFNELPKLESLTQEFLEGICSNCAKESTALRDINVVTALNVLRGQTKEKKRLCLVCSFRYEFTGTLPTVDFIEGLREREQTLIPCPAPYIDVMKDFKTMSTYIDDAAEKSGNSGGPIRAIHRMRTRGSILTKELRGKTDEHRARCLRKEAVFDAEYALIPAADVYRPILKEYKFKVDRSGRKRDEWTDQEKFYAFHAFGRYGLNFNAVTDIVGTKSVEHLKEFYEKNKAKLDKILEKHEKLLNLGQGKEETEKVAAEWEKKAEEA